MPPDTTASIKRAADQLALATRVCVLTGAGISAESGIPTFRGPGGFWLGRRAEDLATPEAFARDSRTVWAFYNYRRKLLRECQPNPAHHTLTRMAPLFNEFTIVTQNIDGLHQKAGNRVVIELHGNIWKIRCCACGQSIDKYGVTLSDDPRCDSCGSLCRPDIVWFGEALPAGPFNAAVAAMQRCQALLVVGTSSIVQPAACLPLLARSGGAFLIEINTEHTVLSPEMDSTILGPAGCALPGLLDALQAARTSAVQ